MTHTVYRDASGLPNDEQITTARDMTILGRAIQDRFPQYYHYFATRTFTYRGEELRNHNHLLGRVAGVDGMKTGYIHDSGFNIVVSMRRGPRHILAVVFGGRTASARDARVVSLLDDTIDIAAAKRTAPPVSRRRGDRRGARQDRPGKQSRLSRRRRSRAEPPTGSTDPIKPNPVKTFAVQAGTMHTASLAPPLADDRKLVRGGKAPTKVTTVIVKRESPPAAGAKPGVLGELPVKVASAGDSVPVAAAAPEPAAKPRSGGWMIQVGAFPEEKEAKQRLVAAQRQGEDPARPGRPVHRTGGEGRQVALSRALCRPGQRSGGNGLQASQAQRNSVHAAEELACNDC